MNDTRPDYPAPDKVLDILHEQPRGTLNLIGHNSSTGALLDSAVREARRVGWDEKAIKLLRLETFSSNYNEFLCLLMDLFDLPDEDDDFLIPDE